jgi:hypothetical protein
MKKSLQINRLHDCESRVTSKTSRRALSGGLVEFSTRAVAGFARG